MKVSYKWLESYFESGFFKKGLPKPDKLAELFNAHAFEVEGMEKVAGDTVFDIKVLPDRAHYALCHRGIAREAGVLAHKPLKERADAGTVSHESIAAPEVNIEATDLCRRYMARRVEGVTVAASPSWLSKRLEAIGARSINNIVDATNFVMYDIGQPLHAFDADKVKGAIVVRKARTGEKVVVLDGRDIELKEGDLLITDSEGILAIAGVKGGKRAEVTESTHNLIVESANFNPTSVRRTSTRTNLRSDSSKRFENEITPALMSEAMDQVTALILKLSKGARAGFVTDIAPSPAQMWQIEVAPAHIASMIGIKLSGDDIKAVMESEGCDVTEVNGQLVIVPPLDRLDLRIPEDVADEVARIKGYDALPSVETPKLAHAVPVDKTFYWGERAKDVLVAIRFSEAQTYALVKKGAFEVTYPLAADKGALREAIAPKLAESLAMNALNADLLGLEAVKMFEIGKVFLREGEKASLAIGAVQVKKKKGVTGESLVKEAVAAVESAFGVSLDAKISMVGAIAVAEIDLDAAVAKLGRTGSFADIAFSPLSADIRYKPFSPYPFIVRDIALFVPATVDESHVHKVLAAVFEKTAGSLLVKGPDCFDRFEKDGKKSFGFRMIFQSFDRTLSDEEVSRFMEAAYEAAKGKGWEVR